MAQSGGAGPEHVYGHGPDGRVDERDRLGATRGRPEAESRRRPRDEDEEDDDGPDRERDFDGAREGARGGHPSDTKRAALTFADGSVGGVPAGFYDSSSSSSSSSSLDEAAARGLAQALSKRALRNQMLRSKHADEPSKFLESEVDLDEELKRFQALASAPALFPALVAEGAVETLVGLLAHDNDDLVVDVLAVLEEMTGEDTVAEDLDGASALFDALLAGSAFAAVVDTVRAFRAKKTSLTPSASSSSSSPSSSSSSEEDAERWSTGQQHAFQVLQNLVEARPAATVELCARTPLLETLLDIVRARALDASKLFASELLAMYAQADPANAQRLGSLRHEAAGDGMNALLECLAPFRRREPESREEEEVVENVVDALCAVLLHPPAREAFREAEGCDLIVRLILQRGFARHGAVKVLESAVAQNAANCVASIEAGAIKALSPGLAGKWAADTRRRVDADAAETETENLVSILVWWLELLPQDHIARLRVLRKFIDDADGAAERVDRLVDLHRDLARRDERTRQRLDDAEHRARGARDRRVDEALGLSRAESDYRERLDAGLFALQRVDTTIALLCTADPRIAARFFQRMREVRVPAESIAAVILESAQHTGDDDPRDDEEEGGGGGGGGGMKKDPGVEESAKGDSPARRERKRLRSLAALVLALAKGEATVKDEAT